MITHTPIEFEFTRKYRFTLKKDVRFYLDDSFPATSERIGFADSDGKVWLEIEGRVVIVPAGYSWNGCSPRPLGKHGIWWLGTPDFPATIRASLLHDSLYQHLDRKDFPYTRPLCDRAFLLMMKAGGFPLARVYWAAVRTFGGIDRMLTR